MTQEQIAQKLRAATQGKPYRGNLTSYVVTSIEEYRSNYPVSNLIAYCKDMCLQLVMFDITTEDCFYPDSVLAVHEVLKLLMERYNVDPKIVYRKTGIHYTIPKVNKSTKDAPITALSIKTLLAVCDVIHCDLYFELI